MHTTRWQITLNIYEDDDHTTAEAVLHTGVGKELRHSAKAIRHPGDRDVPEIGDELAVARALQGLAHDLFEATVLDVMGNTPGGKRPQIDG